MTVALAAAAAFLLMIFLLSLVETSTSRMSRVSLRVLAERERRRHIRLLEKAAKDRIQFLVPLQLAIQALTVAVVTLVSWAAVSSQIPYPALWAFLGLVALIALFRQVIPRYLTQGNPEAYLLRLLPIFSGAYRLLTWLTAPLLWPLRLKRRLAGPKEASPQEETSDEEIQAYLDVGEEDGIFEEQESELIQSALEFGTTLVREIMTPRSEIVMIEDTATISELKDLIGASKHSRIPVYRDRIEQIVGVVYVRNLLVYLDESSRDNPITPLIKKPWFVPETKRVSELLREMQRLSEPMAIVVSEYGSVSGLVTIEDLIEEIVGEIYDEDEAQVVSFQIEEDGSYLVRGGLEIDELEDAMGVDFGEPMVTTMSGLVVAQMGRVPTPGEKVAIGEVEIEIVDSDQKKINQLRIRRAAPDQKPLSDDLKSEEPSKA